MVSYHWCEDCNKPFAASDPLLCPYCHGTNHFPIDREYAKQRLSEIAAMRKLQDDLLTKIDERDFPRRCPTCGTGGGVKREQTFLASGMPREPGKGNLAGQPGNVTGRRVTVRACRCQNGEQE